MPRPEEMQLVKNLCDGKERCSFTPAPSFFGARGCGGDKKTWINWQCHGGIPIERNIDGPPMVMPMMPMCQRHCVLFIFCK